MNIEDRYNQALNYVESLGSSKSILGLDRIRKVLSLFDNPQEKLNIVHIAGTNGKGSTTSMLSHIYKQAGYRVGSFISPSVVEFRERIQYNCNFIEKDIFADIVEAVKNKLEENKCEITHFELITVVAFIYYYIKKCDIVFLEVGLGGRLDATNVITKPFVSVITQIGYDHIDILGKDLKSITSEKCGIIKPNGNVVLYPLQDQETFEIVSQKCKENNSKLYIPDISQLEIYNNDVFKQKIKYKDNEYIIGLNGKYQIYNTLTVLTVVEILNKLGMTCKYSDIYEGIKNTKFAGRFEVVANKPLVILDGAHNKSGIEAFIDNVKNIKNDKKVAIVSILKDKDIDEMIKIFATHFNNIIIVPINTKRGADIEKMKQQVTRYNVNVECIQDYIQAISKAKKYSSEDGLIYIFGSLYLISQIRKIIYNNE